MKTSDGGLYFGSGIDTAGLLSDSERIKRELRSIGQSAETEGSKIDNSFNKILAAGAGIFTIQAATGFITKIAQVRGEFQQLEVAFTTILKSKEKADKLMGEAVKLAAITPFTLQDVATGAKQLLAYGFGAESISKNLTMLGNVASGVSAPLGDIVYLYGTLQTQGRAYTRDIMQFTSRGIPMIDELSKVMGVSKDKIQGLVEAGKVGFPEVEKAMQNMTKEGGMFFNLMEEQSKTITGKISNLSDAFSRMYNDIGKSNEGIISGALDSTIDLVNNYEEVGKSIEALIITFGAYKAALMTLNALQKANATAKYTDEAASLMQLLTAEQKAIISKNNLTVGSAEHVAAVRAEAMAEMERQTQLAVTTQKQMQASTEALALKQKEQISIQQTVLARRAELETAIASSMTEKQASLTKEIAIASEIQAREALRLVKLQEREDVAIAKLASLEQKNASATVIAAKRAEIVAITQKITASKAEIAQQEQNILAKRAEIASIDTGIVSKKVEVAQNKLNLAVEAANTASIEKSAAARVVSSEKAVIDSAVRRANTIETGINTAAQETNIVGTNLLTVAKNKLAAATARLNAFMMANPFVIVAMGVALVALAASMYLLRDKTSAAQKALEEYNDEKKNATEAEEKHKAEIDKLIDSSTNQANADITRLQSLNSLKTAYPEIFKKYDIESLKLADILKIKKEIADIDSNKAKTENITAVDKNQKEIDTITKRIADLKNSEFVTEGTATQITFLEKRLSVLNEKSNIYKHEVDKNNAEAWVTSTLGTYTDAQVKAEIDKRKKAIQLIDNVNEKNGTTLKFRVPVSGLGTFDKGELDTQISALENEQARRKKITSNASQDIDAVKKQIKELEGLRDKASGDNTLTKDQRLTKLKELDTQIAAAKADLTTLQGGKSGIKADKEAEKEADAKAKAQQDILKNDAEFQNKQKDQDFAYRQEKINLLEDSLQKERDQNQLNYDKKIEELKRQAQDELEILKEKAQNEYEAKGGKGISPALSTVELPPERVTAFKDMGKLYLDEMDKANEESLNNLLAKYKDFDKKRSDIDKQYNADFRELISTNVDGKNDAEIAKLIKDWDDARQAINSDQAESLLQTSDLFIRLFSDTSTKSIAEIRKIADEAKALFDYLNNTDSKSIVGQTIGGKSYSKQELVSIQSDPQKMAEIKAQIEDLIKTANEGDIVFGNFKNSIKKIFDGFGKGKNTLADTKKGLEGIQGTFQAISFFANQATDLLNSLSKEEGDAASSAAKSIGAVMDIAGATLQGFEQGGIVGAAVSFAVSVATKVFEAEKAHRQALEKLQDGKIAQQKEYNDLLMKQNELLEKAETIFGTDSYGKAMGYAEVADKYRNASNNANKNLGSATVQTGSHKTGLFGWGGEVADYSGLLSIYPKLIDGQGRLNKELAQSILNNESLDETSKQALQSALDYSQEYEDALNSMEDYLNSVFGQLGNDMMTAIVDNLGRSQDALDEFGKSAAKTIGKLLEDIAFSLFLADDFKKLSDDSKAVIESKTLTPEEKAAATAKLMDDFAMSVEIDSTKANDWLNEWKKKNPDYFPETDKTSSGQSAASQGAFQSMSQDTGNALEGRFTALQMISANIERSVNIIQPDIAVIRINSQITAESLRESRNIALESMNHLADINKNTKLLNETNETLLRIAKHTDNL